MVSFHLKLAVAGLALFASCVLASLPGQVTPKLLDQNCAAYSADMAGAVPKIIGGQGEAPGSSPWMALITNNGRFHCGGSLISPQFVLTAAHCKSDGGSLKVVLGVYDISSDSVDNVKIDVDLQITYPNYQTYSMDDIALFRLARRVQYNEHIKPICLLLEPLLRQQLESLQSFNVTGWGTTSSGRTSSLLQTAAFSNLGRETCALKFQRKIPESQICAGRMDAFTCRGDSGGPLSALIKYGLKQRFFLLGIDSFGFVACNGPTIFTNVVFYIDWIVDTVNANESRIRVPPPPAPNQRRRHHG